MFGIRGVFGGQMVPFFRMHLPGEVYQNLSDVLDSGYLGTGSVVTEFEKSFEKRFSSECFCVAVNSCTSALHLAMVVSGLDRNHMVITTPMTFVGSVLPAIYCDTSLLFVDVSSTSGNVNISEVIEVIRSNVNVRAVVVVHLYGKVVDLDPLLLYRKDSGKEFVIIEDFAHAVETTQFKGDFACFSFYPTKSITCGDGGAILTKSKDMSLYLRTLSESGMLKNAFDRMKKQSAGYELGCIGYKYSMNNLAASMLLPQLNYMDVNLMRRRELTRNYKEAFNCFGHNEVFCILDETNDFCHLFPIILNNPRTRYRLIEHLKEFKIGFAINYPSLLKFTTISKKAKNRAGDCPRAAEFGEKILSLPLYADMSDAEQTEVIDVVYKFFR